jgi:hypothetical protein
VSGTRRWAENYRARGLAVIPLMPATKAPRIAWGEFQRRCPTAAEVRQWWTAHPDDGIAIITGHVSGVCVVDLDPRHGGDESAELLLRRVGPALLDAPTVLTGGGGRHFYFTLPASLAPRSVPALLPGVDVLADGHLAVAPPSVHPNGRPYCWAEGRRLADVALPELPPFIVRCIGDVRRIAAIARAEQLKTARRRGGTPSLAYGLTVAGILARLDGVRRRRDGGYIARCPAHEDHEPSLSIDESATGKVLLFCHAGCSYPEIVHAVYEGTPA